LTERLKALGDAAKDGEEEIEQFNGRMVLMQELINRGGKEAFDTYITDMEHHNELTAAGSDAYQDLAGSFNMMKSQLESNIRKIEQHRDVLGEDTDQVIEALRNGDLTIHQLKNILTSLDKTADAYDDDRKAQEKTAEQYFKSAENVAAYEGALNAGQLAVVNAALAEGNHAEALESVIAYTRSLEARQERLTTRTEALAVAQEQATGAANRLRDAGLGVAAAAEDETARTWDDVLALRAATQARKEAAASAAMLASHTTESAAALSAEAASAREAAQTISDASDARLRSMGADFKSAQEMSREFAYRKGVADAAQAEVDAENERIRLLQEQADLERDALRLANDLRKAHQDVADTVRDIADAERDRDEAIKDQLRIKEEIDALDARGVEIGDRQLAIVDEIAAVTAEITALDAERAKYALDNTEFAASLAHNLNKAKLATITLADKVAELEGTRDAVVDVTSAEENVAALQAQQAAINDVEQALIDMNLISGEDAGLMDLTVREAKTLQRLEAQLRKVEQEYEDGEVDVLALMSATQDYDRAMAEARSGSDELRAAQRALNEVRTEAAVLQKEQENISLKLAIATEDLRLAKLAEAEATDFESARTKELNRIRDIEAGLQDDLLKLGEESAALDTERAQITKALTDAEEEKTAALARQTEAQSALEAATQQQEYAQVRLQRVQDEVNAAQSAQNDLWRELTDLIYDAGGAFADLKDKINDAANAGGGTTGAGGGTGGGAINFAGPSQGGIGLESEWLNTLGEQPKEYRDWFAEIQQSAHYAGQDADREERHPQRRQ
jgi:chromosome segregation ATPase